MIRLFVVFSLVLVVQCSSSDHTRNAFGPTAGCLQFNSDNGYYRVHPYFDTSTFSNIEIDANGVTRMRVGVLGEKNAAIRFSSVSTDSETSMTEIALAHSHNLQTDIRKYPRTIPKDPWLVVMLKKYPMRGLMSIYRTVMMTIEIHRDGFVSVTKDGESVPFLQFNDPTFSHKYIGFCDWDTPVMFYYDCPL